MLSISNLHVGQSFTREGPPMTLESFREFGALLGTDAPIHCDPAYAANTPFKTVIAHGPFLLARFEAWLCELFGDEAWSSGGRISGKFLVPGKVGSTVGLHMSVREIDEDRVALDLSVRCGETVLSVGTAEVPLSARAA